MPRLFCDKWSFTEALLGTKYEEIMQNGSFRPVEIPHDWMIYDTRALYRTGEGWYRRTYTHAPRGTERTVLRFEGVYMDSTLFVNGAVAFEWKYGYTTFEADITDFLVPGENVIALRAVYRDPNTRWYSGAGIYRRVWLKTVPETHILSDGVYIAPKKSASGWTLTVKSETNADRGTVRHTLRDRDGSEITTFTAPVSGGTAEVSVAVENPHLWDPDDTYLYSLKTELYTDGGEPLDESVDAFGFRELALDPERGFFINGRHYKLHGVCEHHDCGALGAAVNAAALRRKLEKLRSMGVNAIRTSHNPPAVELLDLCDELGFLVIDEAFDMWERAKTEYDYARFFPEWHERDVRAWVTRDRNRPCVIMWSIGNEIGDTTSPRGVEVTRELCRLVREYDPCGNAFLTSGSNHMRSENAQKCGEYLDAVGYNYAESLYDEHHNKYSKFCIYGSETSSTLQSRGVYHFPHASRAITHDDHQCSSLFNCTTSWASRSTEYNVTEDRRRRFCLGQFIWTGFDYIGEPTPYDTKNSYFGQLDTAGFPKDSYYAYRAEWTDGKKSPFVHITPSLWDYNDGELIDVTVHTNAACSELFCNGSPVGKFDHDHVSGMKISQFWQLPYTPGILTAIAYDENGVEVARDEVRTPDDPARIVLEPERAEFAADGRDLVYVNISTVDENAVFVANARCRMSVSVSGHGRLLGLDNGDSTDFEQYKTTSRRLFSGRLAAIIASDGEPGDVTVTVSSPALPPASVTLRARPAAVPDGIEIIDNCINTPSPDEVPQRKISLRCPGGRNLTGEHPSVTVSAEIFPANATYREISWRAYTPTGVPADFVRIDADVTSARVTAVSDGEFTLRAYSENGTAYPAVYSELRFTASGVGETRLDPYRRVPGALAENVLDAQGEKEGGIRYVAPASAVFRRVDFGPVGTDTLFVYFMRYGDPHLPFRVTDMTEGEELLGEFKYFADHPWYTYGESSYTLARRLSGVRDLRFDFAQPLVFGGFRFAAPSRAFSPLRAADCDVVYGDAFVRERSAITHIGNNVTVGFNALDFGDGAAAVTVRGMTRRDRDSVEIRIGDSVTTVEFTRTDAPVECTVPVTGAVGAVDVNVVFLPGSDFDLYEIRFER